MGYLDHALGSASLTSQVTAVTEWHINADEPSVLDYNTDFKSPGQIVSLYASDEYRMSDHDPVLVDLNLLVPTIGLCPVDPNVGLQVTDLLGTGQAGRTRKITIPNWQDVDSIYGQLAAIDTGTGIMKYVRFLPQGSAKIQIDTPTSPAYRNNAISWWGNELPAASTSRVSSSGARRATSCRAPSSCGRPITQM
ncbi:MAG: hypothetical protein R3C44_02510 [Chloroflexota bacterium]